MNLNLAPDTSVPATWGYDRMEEASGVNAPDENSRRAALQSARDGDAWNYLCGSLISRRQRLGSARAATRNGNSHWAGVVNYITTDLDKSLPRARSV